MNKDNTKDKQSYFNTLQKAKEYVAHFADGSGTPESRAASVLWYLIDCAQTSPETLGPFHKQPRLITTAPELYEVCKAILEKINESEPDEVLMGSTGKLLVGFTMEQITQLRELVAKAGEGVKD